MFITGASLYQKTVQNISYYYSSISICL